MYTTGGAVRFETNIHATEIFKEQGDKTPAITTYHASKTLTEQSTWKFVKNHADETNWDLTSVKLPFILGLSTMQLITLHSNPPYGGSTTVSWIL